MNVCMNAWKINFGFNIVRADLGTINFFCIPVSDNSSTADKIWWNGELYVTYILRYVFLHLETIVRSVYMELWFVTAVSSPVSLVTARQVTYWTKFGPSRLGQRGGGSRVAKIAPQVMYRSSSFRRFRANYQMLVSRISPTLHFMVSWMQFKSDSICTVTSFWCTSGFFLSALFLARIKIPVFSIDFFL